MFWGFNLLLQEVCYYRILGDNERYKEALSKYQQESWNFFHSLRSETGIALQLTSESIYDRLLSDREWFAKLDQELMDLAGDRNQSIQQWEQLFKKTREVGGEKIGVMLTDIAKDMKLTKERSLAL